jgi:hypothetical protein
LAVRPALPKLVALQPARPERQAEWRPLARRQAQCRLSAGLWLLV